MKEFNQVIDETLSLNSLRFRGARIATNLGGKELLDRAEVYVQNLEKFIDDAANGSASFHFDQYGMEYVLGAFVVGSVKADRQNSFDFLQQLPANWLKAVIESVSVFFWKTRVGYSCGVGPSKALFDFLDWCQKHPNDDVCVVAKDVAKQLKQTESDQGFPDSITS